MAVDKQKFVHAIIDGNKPPRAYVIAGGDAKHSAQNGFAYAKKPEIKRMVNEGLQERVLSGLVALPSLTEKAIECLGGLMESADEKMVLQASKVVLDRAKDFLPKEVNINNTYKVTHDEEKDEAIGKLQEIANKLLKQGTNGAGDSSRILEAVRVDRSEGVQVVDGEFGGDKPESSFAVPAEQETEVSS